MKKIILPFLLITSFSVLAQVEEESCVQTETQIIDEDSIYSLANSKVRFGEEVVLDSFWSDKSTEHSVCYDRSAFKNEEITLKFDKLVQDGIIDSHGCSTYDKNTISNEHSQALFDIMMAELDSSKMRIVGVTDEATHKMEVVLTNSEEEGFSRKNALTTRDKIDIAGVTVASSVIGVLVERKMFPGEKDKLKHRNVGVAINIGGNLASYLIFETAGMGNKLGLTRKQKKVAILLTGSILGAAAGWGKERLYDYYRRDKHTYDPKFKGDMGATWLGGGAMTPLLISIGTSF